MKGVDAAKPKALKLPPGGFGGIDRKWSDRRRSEHQKKE